MEKIFWEDEIKKIFKGNEHQNELKNVAVLLAAYNSEKYILEQIESILSQKI